MKKAAVCLSLLLCIGLLSGCVLNIAETQPTGTETQPEETTAPEKEPGSLVPFTGDELYAAAYLGFQDKSALSEYTQYLPEMPLITYNISDGDCYLVIPRHAGTTLELYQNEMEVEPSRTLICRVEDCGPFLLQCNVSDIFPDATVCLTYQGETVEFSPYLSLKDGSVQIGDRSLDLTLPSE